MDKVINIEAKTSGFDEAKSQIDSVTSSQENLNSATSSYSSVAGTAEGALSGLLGKVDILGVNLGDMYGGLKSSVKGFGDIAKGAKGATTAFNLTTKSTNLFKIALASTGIGLIAIALGTLVAAFLSTQEGMDAVNKVLQPLIAQFQTVVGVVQDVSRNLDKLFSGDVKGFLQGAAEATEGFSEKMEESAEVGARIAEIMKEVSAAEADLAITTANANVKLQQSRAVIDDVNASETERNKAIQEAKRAINEKYAAEDALLVLQLEDLRLKQSLKDASDEELVQLAELEAAYISLTAAKQKEINVIEKKAQSVNNQIQAEKDQAYKAYQDRLQAEADLEAEYAEGRLEKQREFEDFKITLMADSAEKERLIAETKRQRIVEDIEAETLLLEEKYAGDVEKLAQLEAEKLEVIANAELEKEAMFAEIEAKEEEKRLAKEEQRIADEEAELEKIALFEEARRELLNEYKLQDLEGEELEKEEAALAEEARLEALRSQLEQDLLTKQEFDELKKKSEERLTSELADINAKYRAEEKKANLAETQGKISNAKMYTSAVSGMTSTLFEFSNLVGKKGEEEDLKRKKRQFKVNKALQLVNAGIGTAQGIVAALANPFPLNIVMAAAAGITGAAQIAVIAAKKFNPESGEGGAEASEEAAIPQPSAIAEQTQSAKTEVPDINLFGSANAGSTASEVESNEQSPSNSSSSQPIQAFVVESDISQTQDRLETIEQGSEL